MNIIDPATRIIFASSVKVPSHIKYARQAGVQMTTFDTEEELHKIADAYGPDAKYVEHMQLGARTIIIFKLKKLLPHAKFLGLFFASSCAIQPLALILPKNLAPSR